MQKNRMLVALTSFGLTVGVAGTLVIANGKTINKTSGTNPNYTLTINAGDINESDSYTSGSVDLVTDSTKSKPAESQNTVKFNYSNIAYYFDGDYYFTDFKPKAGVLYNDYTSPIRSMISITLNGSGTIKMEWGYAENGNITYEFSEQTNINSNTVISFGDVYPNYFKISAPTIAGAAIKTITIAYDSKCEEGINPYANVNGIKYKKNDTYAEVVGFSTSAVTNAEIVSEVAGLPVTKIKANAFEAYSELETVILPSGLIEIGDQAFSHCEGLTTITIPNTVTCIGDLAFESTYALETVIFQAGGTELLTLGQGVFKESGLVGTVTLPSRIGDIYYDGYLFQACYNLEEFMMNDDNVTGNIMYVEDGVLFIEENGNKCLVNYPTANPATAYTVPSDVTRVMAHGGFFAASYLESITFANTNNLLLDANSLEAASCLNTVNFQPVGDATISIYWFTFSGCTELKSIVIPDNVICMENGFSGVADDSEYPLVLHFVGDSIPNTWAENWCAASDITDGYILTDFNYIA